MVHVIFISVKLDKIMLTILNLAEINIVKRVCVTLVNLAELLESLNIASPT